MVPFHTFLILLAMLVLASCSQTSPPHSTIASDSSQQKTEQPSPSASPTPAFPKNNTVVNLDLDASSGVAHLILVGDEARLLYQVMGIKWTQTVADATHSQFYSKIGTKFKCENHIDQFSCDFPIVLETGEGKESQSLAQVQTLIPEFSPSDIFKSDTFKSVNGQLDYLQYLKFVDETKSAGKGSKVRLYLVGDPARKIYDGLKLKDEKVDLGESTIAQHERLGTNIDCVKEDGFKGKNGHDADWYTCNLYLDSANGSMDLVTEDRILYQ